MTRIERERATVEAMIRLYCGRHHGGRNGGGRNRPPCPECASLLGYATQRLSACSFGEAKPVCVACPVHCYRKDMRERIRVVMRWSGPRMILRHPYLAIRHVADSLKRS